MNDDAPGAPADLPRPRSRVRLPATLGALAGVALAFFGFFWIIDLIVLGPEGGPARLDPFSHLLFDYDAETLQNTLGSLAQTIVAVLGIAITVVSIVVQLAATRYSSHIANMFFRDRTNLAIMGFFVVACIDAVWVSLAVTAQHVPRASVTATLMVVTGSLLLLIPYFAYVFDFLDPGRVVARFGDLTLAAALGKGRWLRQRLDSRQALAAASLEHLADVAVNSVSQKDKVIASHAVGTFRRVLVAYQGGKAGLPAAWFELGTRLREDPDFASMAPASVAQISDRRTWFEWKALRQLRAVFAESLTSLPEVAHGVATESRRIGEAAVAHDDRHSLTAVLMFFNTYLRTALNARDVRTAYNVLNEYRHLAERVMQRGQHAVVEEMAWYFRYYAQTAHGMGLGFVTETAAYDLSVLCERAFDLGASCHDAVLRAFLEIDKEAETKAEEKTLRGVRKAQVRLATYYLQRGAVQQARQIHEDMRAERPERLASIREELSAVTAADFWEVTDRGINFDYLDEARKQRLHEFLRWFEPEGAQERACPPAPLG